MPVGGPDGNPDLQRFEGFQEAYSLALDVSKAARTLPGYEQFELGKQLRRAARSVPANLVEGWAKRASAVEFRRYLQICIGSCEECKFWLEMGRDEGYLAAECCDTLVSRFHLVGAMLQRLWKNWKDLDRSR